MSRSNSINIAMPRSISRMHDRLHRHYNGAADFAAPRFLDAAGKEIKRPAVQGWACLHGKPFFANGRYRVIESGAFIATIHDGKRKRLLFNHDDSQDLGSTDAGLEFENSLTGLAFRMPLSGNPKARAIFDAVMNSEKSCVSIGAEVDEKTVKKADGVEYDLCSRVTINEISLCEEGAVSGTYAKIVDLDEEEPSLWMACRSSSFDGDKVVANCNSNVRRILQKLERLKE